MSNAPIPELLRFSKTKIVATVGPACDSPAMLEALIAAGVDVFRLNMAHGTPADQEPRLRAIRQISDRLQQPVAVLADLGGPKIRLGELTHGELLCNAGECVRFVRGAVSTVPTDLTTTYAPLVDELDAGDRIMLADGTVSLVVESRTADAAVCRVVQPGIVRSRQGVNLPGVKLSVSALTPVDCENAVWAARAGIDFLGLSFVRQADDVRQLKQLLAEHKGHAHIIAKIEKPEALEQLADIVTAADGIMVARGDLGVETDIAEVALAQKRIVGECRRQRKPVIVATQMLDSMQHSRFPTRAEVADVANAILDGADACMLSGETAVGEYPCEAVAMMHRIALATEAYYDASVPAKESGARSQEPGVRSTEGRQKTEDRRQLPRVPSPESPIPNPQSPIPNPQSLQSDNPITEAVVAAAGEIAERLDARLVLVASRSGATALVLAKQRYRVPTLGVSDSEVALRRMCLYWGVFPLAGAPTGSQNDVLDYAIARGRQSGYVRPGDRLILVGGTGTAASAHNQIVVQEVG